MTSMRWLQRHMGDIKVIVDIVPNHTSNRHVFFRRHLRPDADRRRVIGISSVKGEARMANFRQTIGSRFSEVRLGNVFRMDSGISISLRVNSLM